MTKLKTQPTKLPTRKMSAVLVAAAVVAVAKTVIEAYFPNLDVPTTYALIENLVMTVTVAAPGYFVREYDE